MFDKVLVPTDGSPLSHEAVDDAIDYCRRLDAEMTVLYVTPLTPFVNTTMFADYAEKVREQNEAYGRNLLEDVVERAKARGVTCKSMLVSNDQPHRAIIESGVPLKARRSAAARR